MGLLEDLKGMQSDLVGDPSNGHMPALIGRAIVVVEAVRRHRDQKGDDRCWLDDVVLYGSLGDQEVADLRLPPKCDFLRSCAAFWESRNSPAGRIMDPSRLTMAQMEAEIIRLQKGLNELTSMLPVYYNRQIPIYGQKARDFALGILSGLEPPEVSGDDPKKD